MSTTYSFNCPGFVENTWRKGGVCTNCFRLREEHEISVSGHHHRQGQGRMTTSTTTRNSITTATSNSSAVNRNSLMASSNLHPSKTTSDSILPRINLGSGGGSAGVNMSQSQSHSQFGFGYGATGSAALSHNTKSTLYQKQDKLGIGFSHHQNPGSGGGGGFASGRQIHNVNFSVNVNSGGNSENNANRRMERETIDSSGGGGSRKPNFNVGGPMRSTQQRGILKSKDASNKSKSSGRGRNVCFPKEAVEVIGFEEEEHCGASSSDDEDTPTDPQDNASIAELLEKNATTLDEKEFHRLTQKNTNFNSIKTNLLGKTNIEIGPIVGGTGGTSKPLISIGTFETRNEPLKIRKKIDQDSTDEYDNNSASSHRKIVAKTAITTPASTNKSTSSATTTSSIPAPPQQKTVPTTIAQVPISSSASACNAASKAMHNLNISYSTNSNASKSSFGSKSVSTTSTTSANKTTVTSKTVNPPPESSLKPKLETSDNQTTKQSVTISSAKDVGRWSKEPESKNEVNQGSTNKDPVTTTTVEKPALKPKSILKISQTPSPQKNATSPTEINTILPPILSSKFAELKAKSQKSNGGLTNLIILTEGNKIASKRTSFLQDIITQGGKEKSTAAIASNSNGVTIVNSTGASIPPSLESQLSLEKDSLEESKPALPSKLKLNLDLSLDCEVTNPPKPVVPSIGFNGGGTDSEFDDSLEDSGLDIKIKSSTRGTAEEVESLSEESDENEKVGTGSGSDSGNENDYTVSKNKCNGRVKKGHPGLYISVDEEEIIKVDEELKLNVKKPSKLSPDSVLCNSGSGSEMSASGSNESIPESLHEDERRPSTTSTDSSISLKRQAPQPPSQFEQVYDDVANLKSYPLREEDVVEDESLYDDCSTMTSDNDRTITANDASPDSIQQGKAGSYNFQNAQFGDNLNDDTEPVITHRADGIEFIGIRKIDAESFLKERSPTPERRFGFRRSVSPGKGSRERSSSTSPKTKRKVNQFFSTIGKKAGAAFNNSQLGQYTRNKSPSVFTASSTDPNGGGDNSYNYKRSMSSDEVSAARAQEIYATLTPTTLKFKGVLNKLSKIDMNYQDKTKDRKETEEVDCKDKLYKKNGNISKSIKKFLRFGNKEDNYGDGGKYDIYNAPLAISAPIPTPSSLTTSEESGSSPSSISVEEKPRKPSVPTCKPPPPPPRVHSLDLVHKVGVVSTIASGGTVKPARPPPPVRANKIAPSFTAVFNNPSSPTPDSTSSSNEDAMMIPPSKPRRKNSINRSGGVSKDLETSYNQISNLNMETLKLIANQPLTKITSNSFPVIAPEEKVEWSHFDLQTGMRQDAIIHGVGFAFYSARFEGKKCLLMIQECTSAPVSATAFQFSCVQTNFTFQDEVPLEFIPWVPSDNVRSAFGIKASISTFPFFNMWKFEDFIKSSEVPQKEKLLALLQSLHFWDEEELGDLLVLKQPSSDLIYVHPIPNLTTIVRGKRVLSKSSFASDFEVSMKQLLFTSNDSEEYDSSVLSSSDKQILIEKVSGAGEEVKSQLKLFFQLKLFSPSKDSGEFLKIRKYRSEHAIQQWLDKERASVMKEVVEKSFTGRGLSTESISPLRKECLEFLMQPGNSAKSILDMFVELFE